MVAALTAVTSVAKDCTRLPCVGATWVELEQLRFDDKSAMQHAREQWAEKGVPVRVATVGEAYGIAGHVVDTRRYSILAEGDARDAG